MLQHIYIYIYKLSPISANPSSVARRWRSPAFTDLTSHMNFSHAEVGGMMGRGKKLICMVTITGFREPVECKECFPGMIVTCIKA